MSDEARSTAHLDRHLDDLRRSVAVVIAPEEASYDAARRCFNALVDRRPAVIVRCLGAQDVTTAFEFARANALEVAVRGGGHNPAGHGVCDGGLVIDLSLMRKVEVDRNARLPAPRVAPPGLISTPRLRPSASSPPGASSARPASPDSPSAAGSGT